MRDVIDTLATVAELESRQDEVLRQLDELETRLLAVLKQHGVPAVGVAASANAAIAPVPAMSTPSAGQVSRAA